MGAGQASVNQFLQSVPLFAGLDAMAVRFRLRRRTLDA